MKEKLTKVKPLAVYEMCCRADRYDPQAELMSSVQLALLTR